MTPVFNWQRPRLEAPPFCSVSFLLDLSSYWWVVYGLVFGSVATMYVSLNHLASCNTPAVRLPWDVSVPIPNDALEDGGS